MASTPSVLTLKDYQFGFAAAEEEGAYRPDLLLSGYHDPEGLINEAISGRKFLFLGYKGSGKSAVGQHIRLMAGDRHDLFVDLVTLADFPFTPFKKILKGDAEPETKYPTAWSWLMLLYFYESFARDESRTHTDQEQFRNQYDLLRSTGLLPNPDLRRAVLTSSKATFALELSGVKAKVERSYQRQDTTDFPFFIETLKTTALGLRTPNRHLLIIDGLDDVLTRREVQFEALSALIYEANRLNQAFAANGVSAKVLVLCRTDLFERLPGANTNKLRQDAAVHLDWYRDVLHPEDSDLIKLINRRASVSSTTQIDVFGRHLPHRIARLHRSDGQDTRSFLLDLTRHTPRDMIMLMNRLQESAKVPVMSRDDLLRGATAYSKEYFLPEIKNELSGYVPDTHVSLTVELMGSLRKREFTITELEQQAKLLGYPADMDLRVIMKHLFECSAVGNVETWPSGQTYFTFRYRNRHSAFSPNKKILLHFGMWKALNLL